MKEIKIEIPIETYSGKIAIVTLYAATACNIEDNESVKRILPPKITVIDKEDKETKQLPSCNTCAYKLTTGYHENGSDCWRLIQGAGCEYKERIITPRQQGEET